MNRRAFLAGLAASALDVPRKGLVELVLGVACGTIGKISIGCEDTVAVYTNYGEWIEKRSMFPAEKNTQIRVRLFNMARTVVSVW